MTEDKLLFTQAENVTNNWTLKPQATNTEKPLGEWTRE